MNNDYAISPIVFSQFPQWIRDNYPMFIDFVTAYYAYMEQNYNSVTNVLANIRDIADIDNCADQFLTHFPRVYPDSIPQLISVDRRLLSKAMITLYQTKGSITSMQLLLRMLFNVNCDIIYPKNQILRLSNGKWNQDQSIRLNVITGNIDQIIGRVMSAINTTGYATATVTNYSLITGSLYEVFFTDMNPGTSFLSTDKITINGTNVSGTIVATTVAFQVLNGGSGFISGQIFTINTAQGTGSSFKVQTTGTGGTILTVMPVTFGYGYTTNYYVSVYPSTTTSSSPGAMFNDFTSGFLENGLITDGNGNTLQTFLDDTTCPAGMTHSGSKATILIMTGAVANYPGYYTNTDGFLDDDNVLQDGFYWQDFSYVIQSSLPVSVYRNTVQKILHPAGTKMFGEYQLGQDLDLGISLQSGALILNVGLNDFVIPVDILSLTADIPFVGDSTINIDTGSIMLANYWDTTYSDITYVGTTTTF